MAGPCGRYPDPFEVGENEDFDVGDVALRPPPIGIAEVLPCEEILPQGGTCRYAVRIVNNTSASLRGLAWSIVDSFGLGSTLNFTEFEASARRGDQSLARARVSLDARSDDVLGFQFAVPSFVQDGAIFCARIYLGLNPAPLLNTISSQDLFGVEKGRLWLRGDERRRERQDAPTFRPRIPDAAQPASSA